MTAATVTQRFYDAAWNSGDLAAARRLLAPDLVDHDAVAFPGRQPGAEGLLQVVEMVRSGLSELRRDLLVEVSESDLVATRFTDRGVHTGELFGVAATGRSVTVAGINLVRVVDEKIAEIWHVEDIAGLMAQITS